MQMTNSSFVPALPAGRFHPSSSILITGGTGFVGSHLIQLLLKEGYANLFATNFSDREGFVHNLIGKDRVIKIDLKNRRKVFALIKKIKPDKIFHLAAFAALGESFDGAHEILENNIFIQSNLLDGVRKFCPQSRVLIVGSGAEYGDNKNSERRTKNSKLQETDSLHPQSPYALSKVVQDMMGLTYHKSFGLDIVRVRPFNHIGKRQSLSFAIPTFAHEIVNVERNQTNLVRVGNLSAVRDFTDVRDVCRAYLLLMKKGKSGEVYNVGSGHGVSMEQVLDKLISLSFAQVQVEIDEEKLRPVDIPYLVADISKIKKMGWQPQVDLEDTLREVLNEWRER